jgi:hypothetical protein
LLGRATTSISVLRTSWPHGESRCRQRLLELLAAGSGCALQQPAMPVIGFLHAGSPEIYAARRGPWITSLPVFQGLRLPHCRETLMVMATRR